MAKKKKLQLGEKARDKHSGFTGVLAARHEYLNGCIRWTIEGSEGKGDNPKPVGYVFDEQQIERIEEGAPEVKVASTTGGPSEAVAPTEPPQRHAA